MKSQLVATVEGLHSSFGKIDSKVHELISMGLPDADLMTCIHNNWLEQFHSDISPAAVKGMVVHYRAVHGPGPRSKMTRKGRKDRKQQGGMAPVGWIMGPGVTDNVYGRFPVEIGTSPNTIAALDLGRFYESTSGRATNATGGHAAPGQLGGSRRTKGKGKGKGKQRGAGVFDALFMPHMPGSVPRNFVETGVSTLQGSPITNPPPSPVTATPPLAVYNPRPYDATAISNISSMAPIYKPL